ncbi:hypothetical protein O181_049611 [Austropuccinia psidii MF-1]|uniref:Uncharacterized protein n=1 Tax=Austropuccinia psidii MF-1 TaxID=1389203 RepID=A0A9Q3DSP8_9BASI|nr:hypothetical protein [Austropuccinia psidii MF-1]
MNCQVNSWAANRSDDLATQKAVIFSFLPSSIPIFIFSTLTSFSSHTSSLQLKIKYYGKKTIKTMEVCTCPSCKKFTVTDSNGNVFQGLFVHCSTQNKHWERFPNEASENTLSQLLPQLSFNEQPETNTSPHENEELDPVDDEGLGSKKDPEINCAISLASYKTFFFEILV